jgi:hypothetical protein
MQMTSMYWVKCSTQYSNFRDGISPGLSEGQEKAEMKEDRMQRDQRRLAMLVRGARWCPLLSRKTM